jgi:hypothetical protein
MASDAKLDLELDRIHPATQREHADQDLDTRRD